MILLFVAGMLLALALCAFLLIWWGIKHPYK